MFEEVINRHKAIRSVFANNIHDSFGKSIDVNVFGPVELELYKMEAEYKKAELKMAEIHALTMELRTII